MTHRTAAQALIVLATALTSSGAVLAQTAATTDAAAPAAAPAPNLTGNVSLTSNYKFRGQDQDMIGKNDYAKTKGLKPAIQGGFDYAFGDSGFYVGNWNSSVNWLKGNSIESDIYGGYKFKAGPLDMDVGALTYIYPGNSIGNTTELYVGATYANESIGSFTAKYSHTVSKDYFGYAGNKSGSGLKGTNTGYLNLAYSKEIFPKVTLKAAVGYTNMKLVTAIIKPFKLDEVREALSASACRASPSPRSRASAARRATPSCTAARSTWSTSCPR
jgi:uncharacterized protein (TIGR02001 family)